MMPLNQASMAAVATHEAGDAAGLYNMARNLGGSIGLALLGTLIDRRNAYHDAVIRESVTANSAIGQEHMSSSIASFVAQGATMPMPACQAVAQLSGEIARQAAVMTFSETFYALGLALLCCVPLALLLKPPRPGAPVEAGQLNRQIKRSPLMLAPLRAARPALLLLAAALAAAGCTVGPDYRSAPEVGRQCGGGRHLPRMHRNWPRRASLTWPTGGARWATRCWPT